MIQLNSYESERLRFRDLVQEDAQRLFDIYSDKEAMKYRGSKSMTTLDDAKDFISNQKLKDEQHYTIRQGIEVKETAELIGSVMYKFNNDFESECVIGYSIGSDFWNRGFGKESATLLVDNLKNLKNISVVKAWTSKENIASIKILELNEFKQIAQEEFPAFYLYFKKL